MKKILFYIYSLNKGGAERVLLNLSEKLKETHEVVIVTDTIDSLEYPLPAGLRRINLEENTNHKTIIKHQAYRRLRSIRECCKKEKPDVVIAFMASNAIRAICANLFTGNRIIAAIRSNPYDDYGKFPKKQILQVIFSFADKIVCQTQYQKEYFSSPLQKKCVVIPNPLVGEFLVKTSKEEKEKRIVSVGRLFDYKNHKLLIKAFSLIEGVLPEYTVDIYGEGPYREEIEKTIKNLSLENKVFLRGDSNRVAEEIKKASLFVLPSDTEGMPNALMEAMALGLAVISTDCPCGGPKSLIKDGNNGFLCEVGNTEKLAELMKKVLLDKELNKKIGSNAEKIREEYNVEKIAIQWSNLIDEK